MAGTTSPVASNKRDRTSSPADAPSSKETRIDSPPVAGAEVQVVETIPENEDLKLYAALDLPLFQANNRSQDDGDSATTMAPQGESLIIVLPFGA